jgi:hypothetical protein
VSIILGTHGELRRSLRVRLGGARGEHHNRRQAWPAR